MAKEEDKEKKGGEKKDGGDDGGDAKPKFCSCEVGSGLRTKVCCFFCCGDMFQSRSPGDGDEEADGCCASKPWPENPNAPWSKGTCKDIYCIVLFFIFWAVAIGVACVGFTLGSWRRVIYAADFDGQTCGTGPDSASDSPTCPRGLECKENLVLRPNVVWPRLGADVLVSMAAGFDTTDIQGSLTKLKLYGICVDTCPQVGEYVCNYEGERKYLLDALMVKYPLLIASMQDATKKQREATVWACYTEMWNSPAGKLPPGLAGAVPGPGMSGMSGLGMSKECIAVTENCWINPIETKKILFRCIPKFWEISNSGKECKMPERSGELPATWVEGDADTRPILSAGNPGCITVKKTDVSTVDMPKGSEIIFDIMSGVAGSLMKMMADLMNSMYVVIICGLIVSLAMSWAWIIFLQYFVSLIVWTTVAVFYVSWVVITVMLYIKGDILTVTNLKRGGLWLAKLLRTEANINIGNFEDKISAANVTEPPLPAWLQATGPYVEYFGYGAYGMTGGFFVVAIAGIALYKKIKVAIAILREAAKALQALPTLVFFPLLSLAQSALVATWWVIVQLFLMSAGKLTVGEMKDLAPSTGNLTDDLLADKVSKFENDDASKYLQIYHLFVTLWTLNTIEGIGLTVIATSICAWYFTPEVDWKHSSFEEEKVLIHQIHDKPCWSHNKPCFPKLPAEHWAQPCSFQRCFLRGLGCTKCCYVFPSCAAQRRTCQEKAAAKKADAEGGGEDVEEGAVADGGITASTSKNPLADKKNKKVESAIEMTEKGKEKTVEEEADAETERGGDVALPSTATQPDLSDREQLLCAENHGCPRALCCDCKPADGSSPCKVRQFFCKLNKGMDYDGDGEIDCAERMDCRPAPGCCIYTLTCCCFCQLCHYCCMNPIDKDKCWKKGGFRYTVDYLREEACPRNNRPDIEVCTCMKGYCRAATYHVGPILIGSFLIAIIQTARVVMVYIEKQVKQAMGKKKSKIVEKIFAILQGIMWVFEQCMKFITRNTYIMVAMKDLGFARACASAVGLLVSNVFVLAMVKIFAIVIIILGKLVVVAFSAGACLAWLQVDPMFSFDGPLAVNGTIFQTVVVAVMAFMVAEIFFYTFQMTIDTVLLCFCEDCYENDGIPEHNAAIKRVIVRNAAKTPIAGSVIYETTAGGKLEEFDMLLRVDKWSLKDMMKMVHSGNRMDAPGIPEVEEMELVIYDRKAATHFTKLEAGPLKKSKIHVIFKRHFPVFLRKKGDHFPENETTSGNPGEGALNDAMVECLLKHGIKYHPKPPSKKELAAAEAKEKGEKSLERAKSGKTAEL